MPRPKIEGWLMKPKVPLGFHRDRAQKGPCPSGHEEEALDLRRLAFRRIRTRDDREMGPQRRFNALGDLGHGAQVVARRRDDHAEHQIAVAFGQILKLGQKLPGAHGGRDRHRADHQECQEPVPHDPPAEPHDQGDKAARHVVEHGNA
jgi:hypothetical protein